MDSNPYIWEFLWVSSLKSAKREFDSWEKGDCKGERPSGYWAEMYEKGFAEVKKGEFRE